MKGFKTNLVVIITCAFLQSACGGKETENQLPSDVTPPRVINTTPVDQASGISRNAQIIVTFNEAIDESSISSSTFEVSDSSGNNIAGRYIFDENQNSISFTPTTLLNAFSSYTVTLNGGITDTSGNALQPNYSLQFFTR